MASSQQARSVGRVPLRIAVEAGHRTRPLDGAWWPQSRDLEVEFADLVDNFPIEWGVIARLLFSRPDWDTKDEKEYPRTVLARRGSIKIGSFPGDDTNVMVAQLSSRHRLYLLVVPSGTPRGIAHSLISQATDDRNTLTAAELLEKARPAASK